MATKKMPSALANLTVTMPAAEKKAADATNRMLFGETGRRAEDYNDIPTVPVESVKLEKIRERDENSFSFVPNEMLEESIRQYGVINPIAVVQRDGDDMYTISAGHRRFAALKKLHAQYPNDPLYATIDCKIYIVTSDPRKLRLGGQYISEDMEKGIYEDSNLLARQLTERDGATNMRYICSKFNDPEYVQSLYNRLVESGQSARESAPSKWKLAEVVLESMNIQGWKKSKIKMYIAVYNAARFDLIEKIESGEMSVNSAYLTVNPKKNVRNAGRKTKKISTLQKSVEGFVKESKTRKYDSSDMKTLKELIRQLQNVVDKND